MDGSLLTVAIVYLGTEPEERARGQATGRPRTKYTRLHLPSLSEQRCLSLFKFTYDEIRRICSAFKLEPELKFNDFKVDRELAMAILLCRCSFPRKLDDMAFIFGICSTNISRVCNGVSNILYEKCKYGLQFDERQFSEENCKRFAEAIFEKGAFFPIVVGFIDQTTQKTCRPKDAATQDMMYDNREQTYCNRFQVISTPDGIISCLYGSCIGKEDDKRMLSESQMLSRLEAHFESISPDLEFMVYGDEGYPQTKHILQPFRKPLQSKHEKETNISMSKVHVAMKKEISKVSKIFCGCKWMYGNRTNQTKPALKFVIGTVFKNIRTCIRRKPATSSTFGLLPPTLEDYVGGLMRSRSINDIVNE